MSETTITRRRAIGATGSLFLGAGLLGTATAPVAAAPLQIPTTRPTVVNADDLYADCARLLERLRTEEAAYWVAVEALEATLSPEQVKLYHNVSDAGLSRDDTYLEWTHAEAARHVPGLSTIIRLLHLHAIAEDTSAMSTCCTPATGYEP